MAERNVERGTVLIVDDDAAVRDGLGMLMDAAGIATESFASGPELLGWTPPEEPACLLLDLHLPGMDGLAVQQALQARGSELPIIFLTAHGDVPTAVRAVQNGALGFLEKPGFDRQELLTLVQQGLVQYGETLQRRQHCHRIQERIAQLTPANSRWPGWQPPAWRTRSSRPNSASANALSRYTAGAP